MMDFRISDKLDKTKVFLMSLSKIEGRLDPSTYHIDRLSAIQKLKESGVSLNQLKFLVTPSKTTVKEIESPETVYVGLENIETNTGDYIPTNEKETISSALVFKKGDILFPKLRPYLNKVFYATFDGICSTEFHVFKSDELDNEYLTHFLRSNLVVRQTEKLMSGNTLPRVQTSDIYNLLIPTISPEKQEEVNQLLRSAHNNRKLKQKEAKDNLDSIDNYLLSELGINLSKGDHSISKRIFTIPYSESTGKRFDPLFFYQNFLDQLPNGKYGVHSMGKHLKYMFTGFAAGKGNQSSNPEDPIQIRPTNISDKREFQFDRNIYIPSSEIESRKSDLCQLGEVLFNNTNSQELVGKSVLFNLKGNYFCSNHLTRIKTEESLNPSFLNHLLNLYQRNQVFFKLCTNWNNQSGVNVQVLNQLPIPLPKPDVQKEIANNIDLKRQEAHRLEQEANVIFEKARLQVEEMILKS